MLSRQKLVQYGETAGAFTVICGLLGAILVFFAADLPPWAAQTRAAALADEIKAQKEAYTKNTEELKRDQTILTRALLRLDRTYWEKQLEDAKKDLQAHPESRAAREVVREAEAQIAFIDEQLKPGRGIP